MPREEGKEAQYNDELHLILIEEGYDVILRFSGEILYVNSSILTEKSKKFEEMINKVEKENEESPKAKKEVYISDLEPDIVRLMVDYLYNGELLESITIQQAMNLYETAKEYNIDDLASECNDLISKKLTNDEVLEVLLRGHSRDDNEWKEIAIFHLFNNKNFLSTQEWRDFAKENPGLYNQALIKIQELVFHNRSFPELDAFLLEYGMNNK